MKILLDMDGVLANLTQSAIDLFSRNDVCHDDIKSWGLGKYIVPDHISKSNKEFVLWDTIKKTKDFWFNIVPYSWCDDIVRLVKDCDPHFYFCTKPINDPNCVYDKCRWIENLFNCKISKIIFISDKALLAKPDTLLIDDSEENVSSFLTNGGKAILFPQSWNSNRQYINDRIGFLKKELRGDA